MANDRVRLQVKTGVDPEVWSDVGYGSIGQPVPVVVESIDGVIETNEHTGNKEIRVYQENHICAENTTATPLGANGVFTGQWQDATNYNEIRVSVITDQNSALDGLAIQWSANGTDLILGVDDNFTITANKGKAFSTPRNWPYFRVKYTNGTIAQGSFHLISQVDRGSSKGSSHRIADSIVGDDDATLQKSVITGLRDDGVFGNAEMDNANHLMVNSQPYLYTIAEGDISGHSTLLKFGTRTAIAAATQSLIWEGTNALYTYLTSAEQLKVTSSSAQDGVAGTGILTLTMVGLDSNWNELIETVTMNGLTPVTTTASFLRINRAYGATSGSSLTNVGNITITNNAGTNQLVYIPAGDGQTLMTLWTVPVGKEAYLTQITASTDSNKGARVSIYTRLNDGGTLYPWQIKYRAYLFSGNEVFPFNIPFKIPAKTDIEVRYTTPASAGVTSGGATFELWYENV